MLQNNKTLGYQIVKRGHSTTLPTRRTVRRPKIIDKYAGRPALSCPAYRNKIKIRRTVRRTNIKEKYAGQSGVDMSGVQIQNLQYVL